MNANKTWISPDQLIKKDILEYGVLGSKPTENSVCSIEITNVQFKVNTVFSEYIAVNITYPMNVIIGESNTPLDRQIQKCICMMHQGEFSFVVINFPNDGNAISFNIKLCSFEFRGYIYEWDANEKCSISQRHKEKGIELFREHRFKDASHRFSRALRLMLSIPIPVDEAPAVETEQIYKLQANLYNNLASCCSKEKRYNTTIELCTKVLELEQDDVRALYKRGCAYAETRDFERAFEDLTRLLSLDGDNKAAKEKLQYVNMNRSQEEAKFNSIVKKMFRAT